MCQGITSAEATRREQVPVSSSPGPLLHSPCHLATGIPIHAPHSYLVWLLERPAPMVSQFPGQSHRVHSSFCKGNLQKWTRSLLTRKRRNPRKEGLGCRLAWRLKGWDTAAGSAILCPPPMSFVFSNDSCLRRLSLVPSQLSRWSACHTNLRIRVRDLKPVWRARYGGALL